MHFSLYFYTEGLEPGSRGAVSNNSIFNKEDREDDSNNVELPLSLFYRRYYASSSSNNCHYCSSLDDAANLIMRGVS